MYNVVNIIHVKPLLTIYMSASTLEQIYQHLLNVGVAEPRASLHDSENRNPTCF
jgi:hypothetical protein